MTSRYPSFAGDILAVFAERAADLTDIDILQPADPFLDMAGEDLRRRIYLTESETGKSLCLRPEFTIPVCLDHIARRASTPRRYAYLGEVFRQRREGGSEFFQAGIEDLGTTDQPQADARSLADATALLARILPGESLTTTVGDQAIFEAVLSALGLPRGWQKRLLRAFGSTALLTATLEEFISPKAKRTLPPEVASLVAAGDETALVTHIEGAMEAMGYSPSAGRYPQEIAHRLLEKVQLDSLQLSEKTLDALKSFLAIHVPLEQAVETLEAFAEQSGILIDHALADFDRRAKAAAELGLTTTHIHYDAGFGRPLDYYTGFVFEIRSQRLEQPLVGGGRYDRMLTLLGAKAPIPGVGFSVWLDRVATLRETGA